MRHRLLVSAVALAALWPAASFAQGTTAGGAVGGAVVGGAVGGPVGAAVGAGVGATMGASVEPAPAEVRTYVTRESRPSVTVQEEIVVGKPLPKTVKVYTVPKHEKYSYAVVNNQRVIIEPQSRRVIEVIR
jgi:uncharacterized protein YcfJ